MNGEKIYLLNNLSCPRCASMIEKKAGEVEGVNFASVDLVMKRLTLNHDGSVAPDKLLSDVRTLVKSIEPGINLIEITTGKAAQDSGEAEKYRSKELIRLIAGAAVYALGFNGCFTACRRLFVTWDFYFMPCYNRRRSVF